MFTDKATIRVRAGKGGDGMVHFVHAKHAPKGGPDGGNGGRGGDVVVVVDETAHTLSRFRAMKRIEAENGEMGGTSRSAGKTGSNAVVHVPPGTVVKDAESEQLVLDTVDLSAGEPAPIAAGGAGGFGNAHFKSSIRQSPRMRELGEPGEEKEITLELKLIADVGLVGLPNAGKSTLLSLISNANPKIANYPFTTLEPNLGVVKVKGVEFVAADIPGLIEGASKGKGLGDEFLRHVERTRVLVHLVPADSDISNDFLKVMKELKEYKVDLSERPMLVLLSKADLLPDEELARKLNSLKKTAEKFRNIEHVQLISSADREGITEVLAKSAEMLSKHPRPKGTEKEEDFKLWTVADLPKFVDIEKKNGVYYLSGKEVERRFKRTELSNSLSLERLYRILKQMGVIKALRKLGAKEGNEIECAGKSIRFKG